MITKTPATGRVKRSRYRNSWGMVMVTPFVFGQGSAALLLAAAESQRALDWNFRSDQLVHVFRTGRANLSNDIAPQASHAAEPALIICRFVLVVFLGDWMG